MKMYTVNSGSVGWVKDAKYYVVRQGEAIPRADIPDAVFTDNSNRFSEIDDRGRLIEFKAVVVDSTAAAEERVRTTPDPATPEGKLAIKEALENEKESAKVQDDLDEKRKLAILAAEEAGINTNMLLSDVSMDRVVTEAPTRGRK